MIILRLKPLNRQLPSPIRLVPFTLDDAVRTVQVSGDFQNSSKRTTTITTGGFTLKKEDQRAVSLPEKTRTLEPIPFTSNDTAVLGPRGSRGRLPPESQKKIVQPTARPPQSTPEIVEIQQTDSFPGEPVSLTPRPASFVDSSFIESLSDDFDLNFADPQKGVDFITTFLDEPNFTNINLMENINLIGSGNLGSRPVRKARHPSQFR